MMVMLAQSYCHLPSDTAAKILGTSDFGTASSPQIYAEASLDSTLQSGQLDASSAFITQAVELKLPYVKLPDQINLGSAAEKAAYAKATVTVKNGKTYKGIAAGHRHHHGRQQAQRGRYRVRQVHAVPGRPGSVLPRRLHRADADRDRRQERGTGRDPE